MSAIRGMREPEIFTSIFQFPLLQIQSDTGKAQTSIPIRFCTDDLTNVILKPRPSDYGSTNRIKRSERKSESRAVATGPRFNTRLGPDQSNRMLSAGPVARGSDLCANRMLSAGP